jgi:hypothetical protein
MKTTAEIGMKITAAQREFRRYKGISAEMERRGFGTSRLKTPRGTRWPASSNSNGAAGSSATPRLPNADR